MAKQNKKHFKNKDIANTSSNKPNEVAKPVPKSIDMHTHTMRSLDGGLTVAKVLKHALTNNITDLAITDHNNIDGVKKAMRYIENEPDKYGSINLIPGVEISCRDEKLGMKLHMLVYGFDVNNEALNNKLQEIRKKEKEHYYSLFTKLENEFGIKFTPYEIIKASATNAEITLDVIAEMAVLHVDENGTPAPYAASTEEFLTTVKKGMSLTKQLESKQEQLMLNLERFLESELENTPYPSLDEILPIIKEAGGIPVYAHPKHSKFFEETGKPYDEDSHLLLVEKNLQTFKELTEQYGLVAGMEVYHSAHTKQESYFLNLAKQNNLLVSGGSDFHGPHKSLNHRIGTVSNRYHITSLPIVDYIKSGRKESAIYYPSNMNENITQISGDLRKIYANKNRSILDKKALKKTNRLNEVLKTFGTKQMPVHYLNERATNIRRRSNLISLEQEIKDLIASDSEVLNKAKVNRSECLSHFPALNKHYVQFWELMNKYGRLMHSFEHNDTCENKESFKQYVYNTYHHLDTVHKQHLKHRKDMYYVFDIDAKQEAAKCKRTQPKLSSFTTLEQD